MKSEDIMEALGDLPPDLVEESRPRQSKKNPVWLKWAVPAAAVLVIGVGVGLLFGRGNTPGEPAFPVATPTETRGTSSTSTDRGEEPTDPVAEPTDPVTEPTDPITEPTDSVTEPTDPVTQPIETVTQPTPTVTVPAPTVPTGTKPVTTGTDPAPSLTEPAPSATRRAEPTAPPPPPVKEQPELLVKMALAQAAYPVMAQYPTAQPQTAEFAEEYELWQQEKHLRQASYKPSIDKVNRFFEATVPAILSGAGKENRIYSPVNVYMALAMLAETCDGSTRDQLTDLLGYRQMDNLQNQVYDLWNSIYLDDGVGVRILSNSLWLKEGGAFKMDTVEILKEKYYASTFRGKPGTAEFDGALQAWINQQTGNLLKERVGAFHSNPNTEFLLASTLYFKEDWGTGFKITQTEVFHGAAGDRPVTMMKQRMNESDYYWGEHFTAVKKPYGSGSMMTFLLPDEGFTPEDMLNDPEAVSFLAGEKWKNLRQMQVNLTVPKFDVSSELDLVQQLKTLGVTDCFEAGKADFSHLSDTDALYVSRVLHGARVIVDENGTKAASYTVVEVPTKSAPPLLDKIDFTLDRPFIFLISGPATLPQAQCAPLFIGIVNQV